MLTACARARARPPQRGTLMARRAGSRAAPPGRCVGPPSARRGTRPSPSPGAARWSPRLRDSDGAPGGARLNLGSISARARWPRPSPAKRPQQRAAGRLPLSAHLSARSRPQRSAAPRGALSLSRHLLAIPRPRRRAARRPAARARRTRRRTRPRRRTSTSRGRRGCAPSPSRPTCGRAAAPEAQTCARARPATSRRRAYQ